MRDSRGESGRLLVVVVLLVGLSAGVVSWKRVEGAPERFFQEGLDAHSQRAYPRAATAWQEAERLGHLQATRHLGGLYLEGHGVNRNHKRAFELFEKAAKQGDPPAQLQLARLYKAGRGVSPDIEQAVLWYWTASKNEDPEAQLELGRIYEQGRGVEPDHAEAARWYQQAAEAGLGEAQLALGLLYHQGRGVERSTQTAGHWLSRAAEDANLPEAWVLLGSYHEKGLGGFQEDPAQAVWCYEKAAQGLNAEALYRIGRLYQFGRGIEKNLYTAVDYYRRAADQDHVEAQYRLGQAYDRGEGTHHSRKQAQQWYGKAARQGHVDAMAALQDMDLDSPKLSRSEKRRLAKKKREARERRESEHARSMRRPGRCEVYSPTGPVIEMRTRQDCLNRGGDFKDSPGGSQGSFSTVETEKDWRQQRRDLKRQRREQGRLEH